MKSLRRCCASIASEGPLHSSCGSRRFCYFVRSYRLFGENQTVRYAEIIKVGIGLISNEPDRPASKERGDIGGGVRSLHLRFAAKRHSGASHVIYYRITRSSGSSPELVVLRILGDRMEPRRRVASALRADGRVG